MAQMTGTEILDYGRSLAQDGAATTDAEGLLFLNDVLLKWGRDVEVRTTNLAASDTGCIIPANTSNVVLTASDIEDIISFHPSADATLSYPLSPQLNGHPHSLDELWNLYARTPTSQSIQSSTEWEAWGIERSTENAEFWQVFVYPALKIDGYATLKVTKRLEISALTDTPKISYHGARLCARFLAYQLAHDQKQNDSDWLEGLFRVVPRDVMQRWFGEAKLMAATPQGIRSTGLLA